MGLLTEIIRNAPVDVVLRLDDNKQLVTYLLSEEGAGYTAKAQIVHYNVVPYMLLIRVDGLEPHWEEVIAHLAKEYFGGACIVKPSHTLTVVEFSDSNIKLERIEEFLVPVYKLLKLLGGRP